MFNMKGSLIPPTILGVAAIALGVAVLIVPKSFQNGIAIWAIVAIVFGIYVLTGVIVSQVRRKGSK